MHLIRIFSPTCHVCHRLDGPDKLIAKAEGWDLTSYDFDRVMKSNHPFISEIRDWICEWCTDESTGEVEVPTYIVADENWRLTASATVTDIANLKEFVDFYKEDALVFMPGMYEWKLTAFHTEECLECPDLLKYAMKTAYNEGFDYGQKTLRQLYEENRSLLGVAEKYARANNGQIHLPLIVISHIGQDLHVSYGHCPTAEDIDLLVTGFKVNHGLVQVQYSEDPNLESWSEAEVDNTRVKS